MTNKTIETLLDLIEKEIVGAGFELVNYTQQGIIDIAIERNNIIIEEGYNMELDKLLSAYTELYTNFLNNLRIEDGIELRS